MVEGQFRKSHPRPERDKAEMDRRPTPQQGEPPRESRTSRERCRNRILGRAKLVSSLIGFADEPNGSGVEDGRKIATHERGRAEMGIESELDACVQAGVVRVSQWLGRVPSG